MNWLRDADGRRLLAWGTALVLLACTLSFFFLDRALAFAIKAAMGGGPEAFFEQVTKLGKAELYLIPSGVLFVALLALARWRHSERLQRLAALPAFVFAAMAISGIAGNIIKTLLGRYRPRYLFDEGLYGFAGVSHQWAMNSFPSGHTQAAFAAMTALALLYPRLQAAFFALAVMVGASRVLLTVHYLSDVLGGAWLGMGTALALHRWLRSRGVALQ
jgi:membrane-associated phospholipid phosphatase